MDATAPPTTPAWSRARPYPGHGWSSPPWESTHRSCQRAPWGLSATPPLPSPSNIHEVGWWDGAVTDGSTIVAEPAPQPGQPGVAIIAGHVDSALAGPGALYRLKDLNVGDSIRVDLQGHNSDWRVSSEPEMTAKTQLPTSLFDTNGPPRLALVTCGGPFDSATGHYVDNVIVWAVPPLLIPGHQDSLGDIRHQLSIPFGALSGILARNTPLGWGLSRLRIGGASIDLWPRRYGASYPLPRLP